MAVVHCSWCDTYINLDYSQCLWVDGEAMCEQCVEDSDNEELMNRLWFGSAEVTKAEWEQMTSND